MRTAFAVALLACLAPSRPSLAEDDWVQRRIAASELLQEERWEEAALLVDPHARSLAEAVHWAWNHATTADWDAVRRDRVRCGLMAFYVRYCELEAERIADWGPEYVAALARLPEADRPAQPLDFSHLELLRSLAGFSSTLISNANFDAALAAARQNPESIPAIAACLHCVRRGSTERDRNRQADDLRALANVLTGDVGRLTLARHAVGGDMLGHRGLAIRMLEDGWRLAPTEAQQAALLYALAEAQASLYYGGMLGNDEARAALRQALPIYIEVYQSFPDAPAAVLARESAVRWTARLDGPAAGLALVRQLQQAGDSQRAGVAEALNTLASGHLEAKESDRAEALLLEVVRDYPEDAATLRAMLGLAAIVRERGDDDQELHWLKRCVDFPRSDPNSRSYVDVESTRFTAIETLAEWHERHQHWRQALERWESWRPGGWLATCGLGIAGMEQRRREHTAKCHAHLGDHALAAAICWSGHGGSLADTKSTAALLHRLYAEAGQLEDLRQIVDASDRRQRAEWERKRTLRHLTDEERDEYLDSRHVRTLLAGRPLLNRDGSTYAVPEWTAPRAAPDSLPRTLEELEKLAPDED